MLACMGRMYGSCVSLLVSFLGVLFHAVCPYLRTGLCERDVEMSDEFGQQALAAYEFLSAVYLCVLDLDRFHTLRDLFQVVALLSQYLAEHPDVGNGESPVAFFGRAEFLGVGHGVNPLVCHYASASVVIVLQAV